MAKCDHCGKEKPKLVECLENGEIVWLCKDCLSAPTEEEE